MRVAPRRLHRLAGPRLVHHGVLGGSGQFGAPGIRSRGVARRAGLLSLFCGSNLSGWHAYQSVWSLVSSASRLEVLPGGVGFQVSEVATASKPIQRSAVVVCLLSAFIFCSAAAATFFVFHVSSFADMLLQGPCSFLSRCSCLASAPHFRSRPISIQGPQVLDRELHEPSGLRRQALQVHWALRRGLVHRQVHCDSLVPRLISWRRSLCKNYLGVQLHPWIGVLPPA